MPAPAATHQPAPAPAAVQLTFRYRVGDPVNFLDSNGKVFRGTITARAPVQEDGCGWGERYVVRAVIEQYGTVRESEFSARNTMLVDVENHGYVADQITIDVTPGQAIRLTQSPNDCLERQIGL